MTTTKICLFSLCLSFVFASFAWSQESGAMRDETVFIVEPKPMLLSNRFEAGLLGAYDTASNYISEAGMSVQLAYHIRENFSVSVNGTWMFSQGNSGITNDLLGLTTTAGGPVLNPSGGPYLFIAPYARYYRKPWLASFDVQWSPLLGKVSFHDISLGVFQLFITAGAGATGLALWDIENNNAAVPLATTWSFAATFGGGVRFYFLNHFGVKLEIKDFVEPLVARQGLPFKTPEVSSFYLSHSPLLQAGLSYVF